MIREDLFPASSSLLKKQQVCTCVTLLLLGPMPAANRSENKICPFQRPHIPLPEPREEVASIILPIMNQIAFPWLNPASLMKFCPLNKIPHSFS